ncbi:MAG TPA: DNA polymerase III subunit delta [Phycisphaerales bacterium]|nr:DNA polymerase III subunit delta [Phycisphaerales bacterium]
MARKPTAASRAPDASCRVVLLKGKEAFLRAHHTSALKESLEAAHGGVGVFLFDGEKDEPAAILDECRSFGLMDSHKLVIVDNAEAFVGKENRPLVERYVQSPCDGATLLLRAEAWRPGKLDKMIGAVGAVVECKAVTPEQAMKWCRVRAKKRLEAEIDERSAWMLVDRVGPDLARLSSELEKLALAAKESSEGRITPDLVSQMSASSREIEPWAVQEPLLTGDAAAAVGAVRRILDSAPRDAHVPVAMAAAQLAASLYALSARGGARPAEVGKARKLWGDRLRPIEAAARRADRGALRALLTDAIETDAKGKSGVGRPAVSLEVLAARFAQVLR